MNKKDITVRTTFQGAYELSTILYGRYIHKQYMYYTLKEAKELFIEHCNNLKSL